MKNFFGAMFEPLWRVFLDLFAMAVTCAGYGGALAAIALGHNGIIPGFLTVIVAFAGVLGGVFGTGLTKTLRARPDPGNFAQRIRDRDNGSWFGER